MLDPKEFIDFWNTKSFFAFLILIKTVWEEKFKLHHCLGFKKWINHLELLFTNWSNKISINENDDVEINDDTQCGAHETASEEKFNLLDVLDIINLGDFNIDKNALESGKQKFHNTMKKCYYTPSTILCQEISRPAMGNHG